MTTELDRIATKNVKQKIDTAHKKLNIKHAIKFVDFIGKFVSSKTASNVANVSKASSLSSS